jgi:hypothetical protein
MGHKLKSKNHDSHISVSILVFAFAFAFAFAQLLICNKKDLQPTDFVISNPDKFQEERSRFIERNRNTR